jgi:hypothetical protein
VPAPDFQSGEAGFQTRENALFPSDRAFSPGENGPRAIQSAPALISSPRSHALYQGTAFSCAVETAGPLRCALVGTTILLQGQVSLAEALAGTAELSSRPERSVVERPAVSLAVLTHPLKPPVRTLDPDEPPLSCFVSGHDFKSGRKGLKENWALAPAMAHPKRNPCPEIILSGARCFFRRVT